MKKLYRSEENKVFAGVIGGIGEYLDIDPVILRVLWILLVVFTAVVPGVIAYIFSTMVIPKRHNECKHDCECENKCEEKYKHHERNKHHE